MAQRVILRGFVVAYAIWVGACYAKAAEDVVNGKEILNSYAQSLDWEKSVSMVSDIHASISPSSSSPLDTTDEKDHTIFIRDRDSLAFTISKAEFAAIRIPPINFERTNLVIANGKLLWDKPTPDNKIEQVFMQTERSDKSMLARYVGPLDGYLAGDGGKTVPEILVGATAVVVHPQQEIIGLVRCVIVDATTPQGQFTLWLSPEQNYALLKLRLIRGPTSIFNGLPMNAHDASLPDDEQIVKVTVILDGIHNNPCGKYYVAQNGTLLRTTNFKSGRVEIATRSYDRTAIRLEPNLSKNRQFALDVPNGTPVVDLDHQWNGVRYEWKDGNVVVAVNDADQ